MCCQACSGYDLRKSAMIDFFDAEERSTALIFGLYPRHTLAPNWPPWEGGSIPTGLTLHVTAENRSHSREQTSPRS